jgi:TATA-box binding protein (TBP) (component of TFIID and TFIIIB)
VSVASLRSEKLKFQPERFPLSVALRRFASLRCFMYATRSGKYPCTGAKATPGSEQLRQELKTLSRYSGSTTSASVVVQSDPPGNRLGAGSPKWTPRAPQAE